ncbi:MAG: arginine--tRNA ligase [Maricaulis sp.]|uniref:arginine--tRNA ligase n=1 Tax=Maricaulis sp. TaxID=1486257 RepID=UPI001B0BACCC|nr:arginine--tRNA ligase [Maricaulis sp.]MBO6847787.1 arginine--tRNA ligase [Maricaulis sp.]MBO6877358.1 arginine--tRNA ligase [Maricaulis sp.]MDM7983789.1 arginine--tRNA ligase [Maricaulis sp.]
MPSIADQLGAALGDAFASLELPRELGRVSPSKQNPEVFPYQCNGAMPAAKQAKKNPREIAQGVVDALAGNALIEKVEIAGPGFLNLRPSSDAITARAAEIAADERAGAVKTETPRKVMIDFGGPNVAKPMHVGHLRSSVLGDSLQRLLRFRGDDVVSDIHLGDWGLQMGHLITELAEEQPDLVYFDADVTEGYPSEPPVNIEDLARLYPQASNKAKSDADRLEVSRAATAELQAGRPGYRALLRHFIDVSVAALKKDFGDLGVHFDLWKGESDVDPLIPGLVQDFKDRGVAEESEGAWVVRVAREGDKKELAPLILVTSGGASLYGTTDLATILDRKNTVAPDLTLYVVDLAQSDHFEQVFRAAAKAGLAAEGALEHVKFGTVNGKDGKRLRTRDGGTFRLADLISSSIERAGERLKEAGLAADATEEERANVARMVGLAAIKFADLQNYRTTNYVFDLDRFTSFEGKTGPYLLYAAVRVKSLMRKAEREGVAPGAILVGTQEETDLVLALDAFGAALDQACENRAPNAICDHAFTLAQAFSKFYAACPILGADEDATKASRLALARATLKQLELCLHLLGMEAPERM